MKPIYAGDLQEHTVSERVLLVEDIWDSVATIPDAIPLTDKQREELDRRLAAYHKDPNTGSPWEEVKSRIARHS